MRYPALAVVALSTLLAACRDSGVEPPTAAVAPSAAAAHTVLPQADALGQRLTGTPGSCVVATRAANGSYHSRTIVIPLPPNLAGASASTTRFGYRGWAAGLPEPALLVVCTIPNSVAALPVFNAVFGGQSLAAAELRARASAAGVDVSNWGTSYGPMQMQGGPTTYMTDGFLPASLATRITALDAPATRRPGTSPRALDLCDPNAIIPEPGCDPGPNEPETIPDTPPPPPSDPTQLIFDEPNGNVLPSPPPAAPYCTIATDNPHLSTSTGFGGNINVKSWNECTAPMYQSVQATLRREKCFLWVFCSWPVISQSITYVNPNALSVFAPASASCAWQDGWYEGEGYHTTVYMGFAHNGHTQTLGYRIQCW